MPASGIEDDRRLVVVIAKLCVARGRGTQRPPARIGSSASALRRAISGERQRTGVSAVSRMPLPDLNALHQIKGLTRHRSMFLNP